MAITTYKLVRIFKDRPKLTRVLKENVTLAEAQKHCADPEYSSRTAAHCPYGGKYGHWYDTYEKEEIA